MLTLLSERGQLVKVNQTVTENNQFVEETEMVYTYDGAGNRLSAVKTSGDKALCNIQYTYNDNNQITDIDSDCDDDKQTHIILTYDENGNLKNTTCNDTEKVKDYTYDNENRLKAVKENGTLLMAALYDGNGDRIFRLDYRKNSDYVSNQAGTAENVYYPSGSVKNSYDTDVILNEMLIPNGVTQNTAINYELTGYINDVNSEYTQVLTEFGANGNTTNIYEYGAQRNSATINGTKGYYLYDGRGSVSGLTGNSGGSMVTYSYDAYGNTKKSSNSLNNPYQYNAEYTDSSTGLQYLRARYYESSQGRFTTKDTYLGTISNPLSRNLYTYVENNPLNYTDPSGHSLKSVWNSVKNTTSKAVNSVKSVVNKVFGSKGTVTKATVTQNTPKPRAVSPSVATRFGKSITPRNVQDTVNGISKPGLFDSSSNSNASIREKLLLAQQNGIKRNFCETHKMKAKTDWDKVAQGAMIGAAGLVVLSIGAIAIVSTGGLVAPAFAALLLGTASTIDLFVLGTAAAGATAVAFGFSDVLEAGQEIAAGFDMNSNYVSFNPIRDTIFKDAPELYYLTETVTSYGAGYASQIINANRPYFEATVGNNNSSDIDTTTVGRWMSETEYNKMKETGKVQMSPNGNTTYVANPADKSAFEKQAKPGSVYVEFDVDSGRIYPAGNEQWGQIAGPGSLYDRFNQSKGQPGITDMPDASNITIKGRK